MNASFESKSPSFLSVFQFFNFLKSYEGMLPIKRASDQKWYFEGTSKNYIFIFER